MWIEADVQDPRAKAAALEVIILPDNGEGADVRIRPGQSDELV